MFKAAKILCKQTLYGNKGEKIMFRTIRRKAKEIDTEAAKELLESARRGILAVNGDDGYPYAVPINYIYDKETGNEVQEK